jgi:hypothetical protein
LAAAIAIPASGASFVPREHATAKSAASEDRHASDANDANDANDAMGASAPAVSKDINGCRALGVDNDVAP